MIKEIWAENEFVDYFYVLVYMSFLSEKLYIFQFKLLILVNFGMWEYLAKMMWHYR